MQHAAYRTSNVEQGLTSTVRATTAVDGGFVVEATMSKATAGRLTMNGRYGGAAAEEEEQDGE